MSILDTQIKLTAENVQFDGAWKASAQHVNDSAAAVEKASKRIASAQALASKMAGDSVSANSIRYVRAMQAQSQAEESFRRIQKAAKSGYLDEAQGVIVVAAALQRLNAAKKASAALSASPKGSSGVDITGMLAKVGITASIGLVVDKLKDAVAESLEFGEAIQRAAQKTGLSVGTLSTLHYAAAVTGGDFDGMSKAIGRLSKNIGDAADGNVKMAGMFKALGLNAKDLAANSDGATIALQRVAQVLSNTEGPRRQQLAIELLGKGAVDQIPTLIQLANNWDVLKQKAVDAGVALDGKTAASLAATQQRLKDMQQHIEGAALALTQGMVPGLTAMMSVISNGKNQQDAMIDWGQKLSRTFAAVAEVIYSAASAAEYLFGFTEGGRLSKAGSTDLDAAARLKAQAQQFHDIAFGAPGSTPAPTPFLSSPPPDGPGYNPPTDPGTAAKADQLHLKALEAQLAAMELDRPISDKAKFDFWGQHIAEFQSGSEAFQQVLEKQAALAVSGATKAHELITRGMKGVSETANLSPAEADRGIAEFNAMLREQAEDVSRTGERWKAYNAEIAKGAETMAAAAFKIREVMIAHEVATGAISKYDAAVLTTSGHSQEFAAKLDALKAELEGLKQDQANLDPNGKDYEREMPQLVARQQAVQNQIDATQAQSDQQAQQDAWQQFSETGLGGAVAALQEFTAASKDSAAQLKQLTSSTLDSFNKTLLSLMTNPARDNRHAWTGLGKSVFTDISGTALKKGEGSLMSAFGIPGLGGGKLGTRSNPMFVKMADAVPKLPGMGAAPAMPNIPGLGDVDLSGGTNTPQALGQSLFSIGSKTLMAAIPFLADGGPFSPGFAVVGEQGPELVHFGGSGHVTPNHKLSSLGGGETHHHWNIDARGSSNPAETMALVQRGIMQAAPHLIAASVKAGRNDNMRTAPTMRRN